MMTFRLSLLVLPLCVLLTGCEQVGTAKLRLQAADAVAAELKDLVGFKPSTRGSWENGEFKEFVIEFSQAPGRLTTDEVAAHARSAVANHFDAHPRQLTITFADADQG